MKADNLFSWDRAELARILADNLCDAEDLVEAIPSAAKVGQFEEDLLPEYIESNWMMILHNFNLYELNEWLQEKDYEKQWENWREEVDMDWAEYHEQLEEDYFRQIIFLADMFRTMDLAGMRGYPPKQVKS